MEEHWDEFGPPAYQTLAAQMGLLEGAGRKGAPSSPRAEPAERVKAVDDIDGFSAMFQAFGGRAQ